MLGPPLDETDNLNALKNLPYKLWMVGAADLMSVLPSPARAGRVKDLCSPRERSEVCIVSNKQHWRSLLYRAVMAINAPKKITLPQGSDRSGRRWNNRFSGIYWI